MGFPALKGYGPGWLFSPLGTLVSWLLLLAAASGAWIVLMDQQNDVTRHLVLFLGCWWLVGIVAMQWWIPSGTDVYRLREALAAAGWQSSLAVVVTSLIVWLAFFDGTTYRNPGLAGVWAALGAWLVCSIGSGLLMIWLRGHAVEETLRYGLIATVAGTLWMSLGIVAALVQETWRAIHE